MKNPELTPMSYNQYAELYSDGLEGFTIHLLKLMINNGAERFTAGELAEKQAKIAAYEAEK